MAKIVLCGYVIVPNSELNETVRSAMAEHIHLTLAEPGCLDFTLTPDKTNPNRFSLYEEFIDRAAFDFHQARTKKSAWHYASKNIERHFSIIEQPSAD